MFRIMRTQRCENAFSDGAPLVSAYWRSMSALTSRHIAFAPILLRIHLSRLWLGTIFVVETGAGCRRIVGAVSI